MINWSAFLEVAGVAIGFTLVIVSIFSFGIRLLMHTRVITQSVINGSTKEVGREALYRIAAYLLFAITIAVLIYGIYLVIPQAKK